MEENIIAGVSPGGLTDKYLVKILICYLLNSFNINLEREQVEFVLQSEGLVNYFILQEVLADLEEGEHIFVDRSGNKGVYMLTPLGKKTSIDLSHTLPKSIRDISVMKTTELLQKIKTERENEVEIIPHKNGYFVKMILHDTEFDLLDLALFAPDLTQAKKIKNRFLKNPTNLYTAVLDVLTKD